MIYLISLMLCQIKIENKVRKDIENYQVKKVHKKFKRTLLIHSTFLNKKMVLKSK